MDTLGTTSGRLLGKRIRRRLRPWFAPFAACNIPPPFSLEQLVVMALVEGRAPLTAKAVFSWIFAWFPYYTTLASDLMWEPAAFGCPDLSQAPDLHSRNVTHTLHRRAPGFRCQFHTNFYQFEVPIRELKPAETGEQGEVVDADEETQWTVTAGEAQIFLKPLLDDHEHAGNQHFAFLQLPSELRIRIYEMVFALPRVGVRIWRDKFGEMQITTVSKSLSDTFTQSFWFDSENHADMWHRGKPCRGGLDGRGTIKCRSPSQVLSLSLVCKTIREAAMPVFFDINNFVFTDVEALFDFLEATPQRFRKHIRRILLNIKLNRFTPGCRSTRTFHNGEEELLDKSTGSLGDCTGLTDVSIFTRRRAALDEDIAAYHNDSTSEPQALQLIENFAKLDHCRLQFGDHSPTASENELAKCCEESRLGRDMICS